MTVKGGGERYRFARCDRQRLLNQDGDMGFE
jgi:hypothetical protein